MQAPEDEEAAAEADAEGQAAGAEVFQVAPGEHFDGDSGTLMLGTHLRRQCWAPAPTQSAPAADRAEVAVAVAG